jgi:hypothetical protein
MSLKHLSCSEPGLSCSPVPAQPITPAEHDSLLSARHSWLTSAQARRQRIGSNQACNFFRSLKLVIFHSTISLGKPWRCLRPAQPISWFLTFPRSTGSCPSLIGLERRVDKQWLCGQDAAMVPCWCSLVEAQSLRWHTPPTIEGAKVHKSSCQEIAIWSFASRSACRPNRWVTMWAT